MLFEHGGRDNRSGIASHSTRNGRRMAKTGGYSSARSQVQANANGLNPCLAAFWPKRRRHPDRRRPQRGLTGVLYARLTAQALEERGLGKRPASVDFEPDRFRNLYQITHSARRRWKSGITPHVGRTKQPKTEGIERLPK
jgi:hypothetical protein